LQIGEEIEVEIDPGKILIIKLISIGEADSAGRRALFYELNGMPRESVVLDNSLKSVSKASRVKGEPGNPAQACAPMPGMVTEVAVSTGQEVKAGDKLVVLEAMKMLTTVSAAADGTIGEILVQKGEQVDSDDLLVKLVTA
jgi:pyruvate carboxylase